MPKKRTSSSRASRASDEPPKMKDSLPPAPPPDPRTQDLNSDLDDVVPTRGYNLLPMVGLGGSAGGIQALQSFFKAIPEKTGLVYVVVLHLSPDHSSALAQTLQPFTKMPVKTAADGMKVEPDCVYVIPPAKQLTAVDGSLRLGDLVHEQGRRVSVDLFFRSLADSHGAHAAAIVLSGADGDGAVGIKRIKERGGLTIAQDPEEAQHNSMPRAALETGMVDWQLKVGEMAQRIFEYFKLEKLINLPSEKGPQPITSPSEGDPQEAALREVLVFLRLRTGHDFSYYKRATIVRRISRRMQVNGVSDLPGYVQFLRTHVGEAGALLQDLLISVTNFFRDRDAFEEVERVHIPALFKGKTHNDSVRVWVPACATGEEAYSMAMLLMEHARKLESPPVLQVFACDLDEQAIMRARSGSYPEASAADLSEERLRTFFIKEARGYRVRRELREMVLFATHDLLKDPPFSRMDFVSCRNLLIYLNAEAQARAFETFHFSLLPGGRLFLGSSESADDCAHLFTPLDKKHRIYQSLATSRITLPLPAAATALWRTIEAQAKALPAPVVHGKGFSPEQLNVPRLGSGLGHGLDRASLAELHFRLLERFAPPSIVVDSDYEIIHISETAGRFLQFAGGEPSMNILRLAHPMLRPELRSALYHASHSGATAESFRVPIDLEGQRRAVDIRVSPAGDIAPGYFLILLEVTASESAGEAEPSTAMTVPEPILRQMERELERVKTHLRDTAEQYDTSTEELKASNEELQAMNEELRSATEELETSREELQSINEELTTVNQEMKLKVDELAHANSDLQNLIASTSIATVFLDRSLAIMRYTPNAVALFKLIPGDVGRPFGDLRRKIDYPDLLTDCEEVLRTLAPIEREVRDDGHWFLSRIQPYQTVDNRTAGVVLTFVDITERKKAEDALRDSEQRLSLLIESAKEYAIFTTDTERRVSSWNAGAHALFGYSEKEILGKPVDVLFTPEDRAKDEPARLAMVAGEQGHAENQSWHARRNGSLFFVSGSVMPLRPDGGNLVGYVHILRDLTEARRTEEELAAQLEDIRRFNALAVGREERMVELKKEINELCERHGEPRRYPLELEENSPPAQVS